MMYDDLLEIERMRETVENLTATTKRGEHFWQERCERLKKLLLARKLSNADLHRAVIQGALTRNDANWIQGLPEEEDQHYIKPPLGIEPHYIWVQQRKLDLIEAMKRYIKAEVEIPRDWLEEYEKLVVTGPAPKESED